MIAYGIDERFFAHLVPALNTNCFCLCNKLLACPFLKLVAFSTTAARARTVGDARCLLFAGTLATESFIFCVVLDLFSVILCHFFKI